MLKAEVRDCQAEIKSALSDCEIRPRYLMSTAERKADEERLEKCREYTPRSWDPKKGTRLGSGTQSGYSKQEECADKAQKLADLEATCPPTILPPTPAPIPILPPTPVPDLPCTQAKKKKIKMLKAELRDCRADIKSYLSDTCEPRARYLMSTAERKQDEERLRKCREWKQYGRSIKEECANIAEELAYLEEACPPPVLPPIPILPPTPLTPPEPVSPPQPAKINFKDGCRNKKMTRDKMFLGGYTEMAQWMTRFNVGEPCDIGNSGYNPGVDRSDNRKYGFNRSGVREYCEKNKFNFSVESKKDAYKWCCIYGDAIEAELSAINKNKCAKAGHYPI